MTTAAAQPNKPIRHYYCDKGHMWSAVTPPTSCPYCIDGKPCAGSPAEHR